MQSLEIGHSYTIVGFSGPSFIVERLQEIGFKIGMLITLEGRAPFRGPWILHFGAAVFALREDEFQCLQLSKSI